jgi:eukaryotic translation initiation factor 2C
MLQIPASRMPYATVEYKNGSNGQWSKTSGRWNLARQRFIRGAANGVRWKLLQASGVDPRAVTEYIRHFNQQLESTGVCPKNGATHIGQTAVALRNLSESELSNQLQTLLQDKGNGIPDIVVLLLKNSDQQAYSSFKYLADKIFCIQAICAVERSFKPGRGGWDNANSMEQYMANVAMKANLKMRGLNHTVRGVDKQIQHTLILGADITHPGAGAVDACPSIAAVVGSVEDHTGRFRGELSLQKNIDVGIPNKAGIESSHANSARWLNTSRR